MENDANFRTVEFGRTRIAYTVGEPVDQPVQAVICPANARGMMPASGSTSLRVIAGRDVERQAMALAPLDLGSAVVTTAGNFLDRGIERLIHAVIAGEPGAPARLPVVRQALAASLELVHTQRLHSVAVPVMGIGSDASSEKRRLWIAAIVDELVAHVRRDRSRLDLVVVAVRYPDDLEVTGDVLADARAHAWRS